MENVTEDHMSTLENSPIHGDRRPGSQPDPATDPVCGMQVAQVEEALTIDYKGHQYHFCSTTCRDTFRADPEKFA